MRNHTFRIEDPSSNSRLIQMRLDLYSEIDPNLFGAQSSGDVQRALFKRYVRNITLELFDYCNRQCTYCPVSLIDRRSAVRLMSNDHYTQLRRDLVAIDYDEAICLNLFNEPLAHERTFEALADLNAALPNARIWFNTNGDYLNRKALERLVASGCKRITVTLHLPPDGDGYDDKLQMTRISQLSARTGLGFKFEKFRPGIDMRATARFKGLSITVKSVNYTDHGVNRGGALEHIPVEQKRTAPCDRPFHDFTVAWNGNVYPCCQFVDGFADHSNFIVGNLSDTPNIYALFTAKMMASFRRDTFGYGDKRAPCDTCTDQ
ncbi:MAG: radical SAM/SPASM domain-containing protein, partial [Pseudomonadota bacterium]